MAALVAWQVTQEPALPYAWFQLYPLSRIQMTLTFLPSSL